MFRERFFGRSSRQDVAYGPPTSSARLAKVPAGLSLTVWLELFSSKTSRPQEVESGIAFGLENPSVMPTDDTIRIGYPQVDTDAMF